MVFSNNLLLGAGGQGTVGPATFDSTLIGNSVWLDGSADELTRATSSHSSTECVMAGWIQLQKFSGSVGMMGLGTGSTGSNNSGIWFDGGALYLYANGQAAVTTALYRDVGWYHVLASFKLDETVAADKGRVFVNGLEVTSFSADNRGTWGTSFTNTTTQSVGSIATNIFLDGYITQAIMLDGQSIQGGDVAITDFLDTFTFGTNGSEFIPKSDAAIAALATTAAGNSFCLDFSNSGSLGLDISTPANNLTPESMDSTNQSTNTPSLQFPVLNALNGDATLVAALEYGNRLGVGVSNWDSVFATKSMGTTGKYYYEVRVHTETGSNGFPAGIHEEGTTSKNWANYIGNTTATYGLGYALYSATSFYTNNSETSLGSALSSGDIVNMAVDLDNNKLFWGLNGVYYSSGNPSTGANPTTTIQADTEYVFGMSPSTDEDYFVNFGQDSTFGGTTTAGGNTDTNGVGNFKYTVPTGFQCLASSSLSAPSYQGIDYFAPTLYEGNGTGQRVGDFVPFTDAYTVTNSVMFEDGDSRSLTLNSSATRTSATVAAFSLWTKRANLGTNQRPLTVQVDSNNYFSIYYDTSDQLDFTINNGGSTILQRITTRAFKDTSAWHNIVVIINQGNGTQADRVKVFYDGVQIPNTSAGFGTNTCTLDGSSALNFLDSASAVNDVGGGSSTGFTQTYDGYVSEVAFLDGADSGAKLNASDFGQVDTSTNRWTPKDIGSYDFGNTGYYLEFKVAPGTSNGAGTDTSGESNNFTSNGSWATSDQFTDSPSKNFTIFDSGYSGGGSNVWSEGNTKVKGTDGSLSDSSTTTFGMTGKVVFQFQMNTVLSGYPQVGFITSQTGLAAINAASGSIEMGTASVPGSFAYTDTGTFKVPGGTESTAFSSVTSLQALDADDVIRFEVDTSAGTMRAYFQNEGTGSFSEITGARVDNFSFDPSFGIRPAVSNFNNSIVTLQTGGQTTLASVTADYKEINQDNLDDTASKLTAWAWIKNRDATDNHILVDRVRGVGNDLHSNAPTGTTDPAPAEVFNANTVQRFLQRGVQVGSDVEVNTANESYVLWQWLVGDSATTGSSITAGSPSLATTGIVADADHFAVLSYTGNATSGATIAHGLSAAPELIMHKERDNANGWIVGSTPVGFTKMLRLDQPDVEGLDAAAFNDVAPNSTLITLGDGNGTNRSGGKLICYAFRSVAGVCKVGSYTGSGDANGPYISTGFKPSFIMIKRSAGGTGDWNILDTSREPFNAASPLVIRANLTTADEAGSIGDFDILSDGFKLKAVSANANTASSTYIYLAMADIGGNGTLPPIYGR